MGEGGSKEAVVFHPPQPPSYSDGSFFASFQDLEYVVIENSKVPGLWTAWKSSTGDPAYFTLLLSHDRDEDLGSVIGEIRMLRDVLHVNVFAYEYSGFGAHRGELSEQACYEHARQAWHYVTRVRQIPGARVILMGRTLGSAPSIWLAYTLAKESSSSATTSGGGGAGSEAGTRVVRLAGGRSARVPEGYPAGLVLTCPLTSLFSIRSGAALQLGGADMLENIRRVERVLCPTLLVHLVSEAEVIPLGHSQKLAKKLGARAWRLVEVRDAAVAHQQLWRSNEFLDATLEFLAFLAPPGAAAVKARPVPATLAFSPDRLVAAWLRSLDLEQFVPLFLAHGIYEAQAVAALLPAASSASGPVEDDLLASLPEPARQRVLESIQSGRYVSFFAAPGPALLQTPASSSSATSDKPKRRSPAARRERDERDKEEKEKEKEKGRGLFWGWARKARDAAGASEAEPPPPFPGIRLRTDKEPPPRARSPSPNAPAKARSLPTLNSSPPPASDGPQHQPQSQPQPQPQQPQPQPQPQQQQQQQQPLSPRRQLRVGVGRVLPASSRKVLPGELEHQPPQSQPSPGRSAPGQGIAARARFFERQKSEPEISGARDATAADAPEVRVENHDAAAASITSSSRRRFAEALTKFRKVSEKQPAPLAPTSARSLRGSKGHTMPADLREALLVTSVGADAAALREVEAALKELASQSSSGETAEALLRQKARVAAVAERLAGLESLLQRLNEHLDLTGSRPTFVV